MADHVDRAELLSGRVHARLHCLRIRILELEEVGR
jgi:hypothetical protein